MPSHDVLIIGAGLAGRLPSGMVRLGARVESIVGRTVRLQSNELLSVDAIVLAIEAPEAERLLGHRPETASNNGALLSDRRTAGTVLEGSAI